MPSDATSRARGRLPDNVGDSPPPGLADRLAILRSLHVRQRGDDGPPALREGTRPPALSRTILSILVAARLRELRALDELARYLHQAQVDPPKAAKV